MGRPGLHVRGPSPSRPSPSATAPPFRVRGDHPKKQRMVPKLSGEGLLRLMTIKSFPPPRPSVLFQYQSAHCSSIIQSVSLQCFSFSFLRPFSLSPLGGAVFIFGVFFSLPLFLSPPPPLLWSPSMGSKCFSFPFKIGGTHLHSFGIFILSSNIYSCCANKRPDQTKLIEIRHSNAAAIVTG